MIQGNLGRSGQKISKICLGTMTFGQQNNLVEAMHQMDFALDHGVNFFDTAEMYPVPAQSSTSGSTEQFIGEWLQRRKTRDKVFIATKVTGPGVHVSHVSHDLRFSKIRIKSALESSLKRLNTDCIDLYQLHWPERKTNCFGKMGFIPDPGDEWNDNIHEVVKTMAELKKEGKIRFWGISNETPWGLMKYLQSASSTEGIFPVSIQNPYNLVNRTFEIGLAEMAYREEISLLAYSPLAFGLLTGKYHDKTAKPDARLFQFKQMARYNSENTYIAAGKYIDLAKKYNLSPAQMAIAYLLTKPYVQSVIIGATSLGQLKENIEASSLNLPQELINEIEKIHASIPNPAP